MGSIDKAVVIGFICRLCSKVNRLVIPIFSEEGERLQLVRMIREYLSLSISVNDPLPKTICLSCIERLKEHNEMREKWHLAQRRFQEQQALLAPQMANTQNSSTG
ncbi:uncharacterized protein [Hetaerina americana]|uniref:uncharacterized protein n=1 Tax=Hetaerina americana TaxID=62018 RepID=UPI003A7F57D2